MPHFNAAPRHGRARRLLTGITALAALVAVVGGVPLVLLIAWHHVGAPIPTLSQLTSRDDGTTFVRVLTGLGWAAWATFTWAVIAEAAAQWHGWQLPALRWQQQMMAGLVASVSLMFTAPAVANAAPVAAAAFHPPVAAVAYATPTDTPAPTAPAVPTYQVHTVQRGEQLTTLAHRYYGDRYQWTRIATANYGLDQPGGKALRPGETRVYPGWQLRLPTAGMVTNELAAPTAGPVPAGDVAASSHLVYTIKHGDWLWYIADRYLGNPERYSDIAALNPGYFTATTGVHGPDHIQAGWHLILPADAHDRGPQTHAHGSTHSNAATTPPITKPGHGTTPTTAPTITPTTPAPTVTPYPTATDAPGPAPATIAPAVSAAPTTAPALAPSATPSESSSHDAAELAALGGIIGTGLLAALTLAGLRRARRRQQQHRRPQRRLPHPRGGATEAALLAAQQPLDVDRLDAALRTLGADLGDRAEDHLPDIVAATVGDGAIHLHLEQPCPAPAGWIDDGTTWTLPESVTLPTVDGQVAPLPTLVTIGTQPGRHILLDLERLGSLHLDGDPDRARNLLRYIASELACNSWSDDVEIILTGFDHTDAELLVALNPDRVRAVASTIDAIARLRRRVTAATTTLRHVGAHDALAGRIGDLAGDAWMPQVLLIANPDHEQQTALDELNDDLAAASRCAVAVVTAGAATSGDRTLGAYQLSVAADGNTNIAIAALTVAATAAGLPITELEPLADIMRTAREIIDDPVPAAPETEPWAADTDAAGGVLGLFGRPEPPPHAPYEETDDNDDRPTAKVVPLDPWRQTEPVELRPTADGTTPSPLPAAALNGSRRNEAAAIRQRRRLSDPNLDRDLHAWRNHDPQLVHVGILGPVTVTTPEDDPVERRLFLAEIIVYLAQRGARGATGERLSDALWPEGNVKDNTRRVAITRTRRWLGDTPSGELWLPDMGADRTYRLADGYLLDWHLFRRLRARGETHGPAGVRDLRAALELIRGTPLEGAERAYATGTRNPYPWLPESDIYPGHVVSAIADTGHELATLYLDAGDTKNARWAVQQAWLADPHRGDDALWRDIMQAEHADGHTAQLRQLLGELMQSREAEVPEDLSAETYTWLRKAIPDVLDGR